MDRSLINNIGQKHFDSRFFFLFSANVRYTQEGNKHYIQISTYIGSSSGPHIPSSMSGSSAASGSSYNNGNLYSNPASPWIPRSNSIGEFLEIRLPQPSYVTAIDTRGDLAGRFVKKYTIQFQNPDDLSWIDYKVYISLIFLY